MTLAYTKFMHMIRYLSVIIIVGFIQISCNRVEQKKAIPDQPQQIETKLYSHSVADSFYISVSLPDEYYSHSQQQYPVVYLPDANLYFDIMATTLRKYAAVGLTSEVILVGIGYKDFPTMDSLRNRDYTYPVAIPEYEMSTSGGADKFLSFIRTELMPFIDSAYRSDSSQRTLMGHSLGGYFTMYAMLQQLTGKSNGFSRYIAASPSLHYNHYYLLDQFLKTGTQQVNQDKISIYLTFGGLEETEDTDTGSIKLSALVTRLSKSVPADRVDFKADIYSNLGHMDTQLPTFLKGLQWVTR